MQIGAGTSVHGVFAPVLSRALALGYTTFCGNFMTISRNALQGTGFIAVLSAGFFALARHFYPIAPAATQWIVVWAAMESLASFYSLSWAFRKSDKIFFSFFVGGSVFRLASLGVIAALLYVYHVPLMIPLLSLVFLYFVFSLLQVPYITHGLW
jgi:hypothetical protein